MEYLKHLKVIGLIPSPSDTCELWEQLPACPVTKQRPMFSILTVHKSSFSKQFNKCGSTTCDTSNKRL